MTQEDRELLLKDLCARLPYGVKAILSEYHVDEVPYNGTYCNKVINLGICGDTINLLNHIEKYGVKPYLRPMSSMTEEECDMVEEILGDNCIFDFMSNGDIILKQGQFSQKKLSKLYDYYNSIHIDYRGLISMGLALEAPEGMYTLNK